MRCLNCHTVVAETDRTCISCGAPIGNAAYKQRSHVKPFFAVAFMVVGAVTYNLYAPPAKAVAANGGRINMEHAMWAGIVGAICAVVGGAFDAVLGGERRRRESRAAVVTLTHVAPRRDNLLDATPSIHPRRAETAPRPSGSTPDLTRGRLAGPAPRR